MRYNNARDVLPEELITELQRYVDGVYLYVPRKQENRLSWGERTRSKQDIRRRNRDIYRRHLEGVPPQRLAADFFLTEKTIRRIIREERRGSG